MSRIFFNSRTLIVKRYVIEYVKNVPHHNLFKPVKLYTTIQITNNFCTPFFSPHNSSAIIFCYTISFIYCHWHKGGRGGWMKISKIFLDHIQLRTYTVYLSLRCPTVYKHVLTIIEFFIYLFIHVQKMCR